MAPTIRCVRPSGPVSGRLAAPSSKSVTNRLLVQAALAEGTSTLHRALDSDDAAAMRDGIAALGATVTVDGDTVTVVGTGGAPTAPAEPIDCRLSGTTIRFLTAVAPLASGRTELTGQGSLLRRPIGPLVAALGELGAEVRDHDGLPPIQTAGGGLAGGHVTVDVTGSSQFASAVLLAAPCARSRVVVAARGESARRYIDLTAAGMVEWGVEIDDDGAGRWAVEPGGYVSRTATVEYDASAAAHLLALAAASGGTVTVTGTAPRTLQPDAGMLRVLASMGAAVTHAPPNPDGTVDVTVTGPDELAPIDVDLSAMPDQVTTTAALAALASGRSTITGAAVARGHETDRLAALARELGALGVTVTERPDGLVIDGGTARGGAVLDTHDDHRLAMAFASIAVAVEGVRIADPGCVAKTYPGFWDDLANLGPAWDDEA